MSDAAYLFPGQGSQQVGMGRALSEGFDVARETFAEADAILGFPLSDLCFRGPAETLTETINAQPAILVTSVAAWRSLRAARPDLPAACCCAGHSLGEYSALVASGSLAFADAVRLTRKRGELMAQAGAQHPGSMAAVLRLADEQVAEICRQAAEASGDAVQVANYNSPGQVVISGGPAGVAAAGELAKGAGGRVMPLAVSVAAHSVLMAPAATEFAQHVAETEFKSPEIPVFGNVHALPLATPAEIRAELVAQLTSPVLWTTSVNRMVEAGTKRCLELGPGNVLTGLVRRINASLATFNVAEPAQIQSLAL
jgi:[acyl-carrier-protein] S-malonyltransferase